MAPYFPSALPSRTVPLAARQASAATTTVTVTVTSVPVHGGSGTTLSGGAIAGIVIGSMVGALLLLWIVRSCFNLGAPPEAEPWYGHRAEPKHHHHHHHHRRPRSRQRSRSSSLTLPPEVVVRQERTRSGGRRSASRRVYKAY